MSSFKERKVSGRPNKPDHWSILPQHGEPVWSIERVVTLLTPLFGAASALVTGWLGQHFPGFPALNPTDVTALQIAGFTGAVVAALKWLHGRQKFVNSTTDVEQTMEQVFRKVMADQQAGPALTDIAKLLEDHQSAIIDQLGHKIGAPASAEEVAKQLLDQLERRQSALAQAANIVGGGGAPPASTAASATPGAVAAS